MSAKASDRGGSSLTEAAYHRIRGDLLSCHYPPGARLRVNDLCAELGFSQGAVREALSRLCSEGFVISRAQYGFRAADATREELEDLVKARIEIEVLCVRRAIQFGDIGWETDIVAAAHRLERTEAISETGLVSDTWSSSHEQFHQALAAGCDIRLLREIRQQLWERSERYRRIAGPITSRVRDVQQEHAALVDAVLARDADRAAELIRVHLTITAHALLESPFVS
jgi:DNA-binding GntR family transcriptional regulator